MRVEVKVEPLEATPAEAEMDRLLTARYSLFSECVTPKEEEEDAVKQEPGERDVVKAACDYACIRACSFTSRLVAAVFSAAWLDEGGGASDIGGDGGEASLEMEWSDAVKEEDDAGDCYRCSLM